jgi:hypothetical protein
METTESGWAVTIEAAGDPAALGHITEEEYGDLLGGFLELFVDDGGVVSGGHDRERYGVTFSIDASDEISPIEILGLALQLFHERADKADMPPWPVVRCELLTYAEQAAELERPNFPELVGVTEIARTLEVSRQRASKLSKQHGFPAYVADLASGPVWTRPSLNYWIETWQRRPGRPLTRSQGETMLAKVAERDRLQEQLRRTDDDATAKRISASLRRIVAELEDMNQEIEGAPKLQKGT